ncbi:MAG: hypothetical protein RLZZ232_2586, partial [Planctomycetota bacterium]
VRLLMATSQTGRAVAELSFLSGGFLLITVIGPMLLAGQGALNAIHGRPGDHKTEVSVPADGSKGEASPAESASQATGGEQPVDRGRSR